MICNCYVSTFTFSFLRAEDMVLVVFHYSVSCLTNVYFQMYINIEHIDSPFCFLQK